MDSAMHGAAQNEEAAFHHDGTSPLPLGMDASPPPAKWVGPRTVWPLDFRTGWSFCATIPSFTFESSTSIRPFPTIPATPVVLYRVCVCLQSPHGISSMRIVLRRFSDFMRLHAALRREHSRSSIPAPPPKHALQRLVQNEDMLQERRFALESWLQQLLRDIHLSRSSSVAAFLELEAAAREAATEEDGNPAESSPMMLTSSADASSTTEQQQIRSIQAAGHASSSVFDALTAGGQDQAPIGLGHLPPLSASSMASSPTASSSGLGWELFPGSLSHNANSRQQDLRAQKTQPHGAKDLEASASELVDVHARGAGRVEKTKSLAVEGGIGGEKDGMSDSQAEMALFGGLEVHSDADFSVEKGAVDRQDEATCDELPRSSSQSETADSLQEAQEALPTRVDFDLSKANKQAGGGRLDGRGPGRRGGGGGGGRGGDEGVMEVAEEILVVEESQRGAMRRWLEETKRRVAAAAEDVQAMQARMQQEAAVKSFLASKVRDLEFELDSLRRRMRDDVALALAEERQRAVEEQWAVESTRLRLVEVESELQKEQEERRGIEQRLAAALEEVSELRGQNNHLREASAQETSDKSADERDARGKGGQGVGMVEKEKVKLIAKEVQKLRKANTELVRGKEEAELQVKQLQEEKLAVEKAAWARRKQFEHLLQEVRSLSQRLKDCSLEKLAKEEVTLNVAKESIEQVEESVDLLRTSDNRLDLLNAEAQLLRDASSIESSHHDDFPTNEMHNAGRSEQSLIDGVYHELCFILASLLVDLGETKKSVNSLLRHAYIVAKD